MATHHVFNNTKDVRQANRYRQAHIQRRKQVIMQFCRMKKRRLAWIHGEYDLVSEHLKCT